MDHICTSLFIAKINYLSLACRPTSGQQLPANRRGLPTGSQRAMTVVPLKNYAAVAGDGEAWRLGGPGSLLVALPPDLNHFCPNTKQDRTGPSTLLAWGRACALHAS